MLIQTETLLLRPFEPGDLADLHAYCAQDGVGEAAGWPHHTTPDESRATLAQFLADPDCLAVVRRPEGRVIGHIHIGPDSEEGRADVRELGCVLNRDWQRRGVMSALLPRVLERLFDGEIETVWACCFRGNEGSRRLIERCGFAFVQEGTFESAALGKTFDSYEYRWTRARWRETHGGKNG